jgi:hypothetical protein
MCPDATGEELLKKLHTSPTDLKKLVEAVLYRDRPVVAIPHRAIDRWQRDGPRELEVSASLAGFPRNKNRLSVTGTGWEPTPWRVRREALRRSNLWTAVTMSENIVRYLSQQASDGMPMAALHQR